jgi:hypothetical protein
MKLTDTQRALLEAAAQHPQKKLTNFPDTIKGGARIKVLTAMRNAQLIESSAAEPEVYVATATGLQAIGITIQAPRAKREGTKQAVLIELLTRAEGATLPQMATSLWLTMALAVEPLANAANELALQEVQALVIV